MSSTPSVEKHEDVAVDVAPTLHEKAIIRKIDWRLVPILSLLYAYCLIDRSNLGLVNIAGMNRALGLSVGNRYSIVALVYFIGYSLLEIPANLIVRKVSPRIFIPAISVIWGCITLAEGFVKNWKSLVGLRVLLGILEAGFLPAATLLISTWYIRKEVQTRLAAFFVTSVCASGINPILGWGISHLNGTHKIAGWRWIFIVEGTITAGLGIIAYFLVVDFPEKNSFLSPEETQWVQDRIDKDRGDAEPDPLTWAKVKTYAADLKVWAFALCFMCTTIPINAVTFFLPGILTGMGYSVRDSFLLVAPPFVTGGLYAIILARFSDRTMKRAPFMILSCLVCIVGLAMTGFSHKNAVRYAGVFITVCGSSANVPGVLAYQSNNVVGQAKKGFTTAIVTAFGSIGGIIATVVFRGQDAPRYQPGFIACLVSQALMIVILIVCSAHFMVKNKAALRNNAATIEGTAGFTYTI